MPALLSPVLDLLMLRGTSTETEPIAARIRRLRVEGDAPAGPEVRPGRQVRVLVGSGLTRRTYSVWRYEAAGAVEWCVLDHPEAGPGARWGRTAGVGDEVRLGRPEGSFVLRPEAAHHVFVGEETASVAFGAMLAALPGQARISGCVETLTAADRLTSAASRRAPPPVAARRHVAAGGRYDGSLPSRVASRTSPGRRGPCRRYGGCSSGRRAGTGGRPHQALLGAGQARNGVTAAATRTTCPSGRRTPVPS